jgi:hypothetical protein
MAALFTELFRVSPDALDTLLDPELEPDPETSIWLRGLGDLELVGLWETLPNAESDGTLMAEPLSDLEAEFVLLGVPDNFLQCIRSLTDAQIPDVVARWKQMDELASWSPEDLTQYVHDIRRIANDSATNNQLVVQRTEGI